MSERLKCALQDCLIVDFTAGADYSADDLFMLGECPAMALDDVSSGGTGLAIIGAKMIEMPASTNSTASSANFVVGHRVFMRTDGMGIVPDQAGTNSAGTIVCGFALENAAKTAGAGTGVLCALNPGMTKANE
jgi:hypothetical protein